jgi:serine/threonine-protein kinase
MATVYLARTVGPGGFAAEVALKLTHTHLRETPGFALDLLEEAKLVSRIRHHNVVPVIDVGEDPRGIYLVMEYVEGDSLAGIFRKEPAIPLPIAGRFILDALAGLHAAHELRGEDGQLVGVVHRDFTPHNILVGIDGVARLADFGIAKAATRLGHTRVGMVKGKIAYMPPEQAKGQPLDRRCDVWAAGVVAWEMFGGQRLYGDDEDIAILLKVATQPPPPLSSVAPKVPQALSDAVAQALTMDCDQRCPTAAELARLLGNALRGSVGVADPSEAAEWMLRLVWPRVSERRMQAAEIRARRDSTSGTSVERAAVSGSTSRAALTGPTAPTALSEPTALLPTRVVTGESETRFTDGVSVVTQRATGPLGLTRQRVGLVALAIALLAVVVVWSLTPQERSAPRTVEPTSMVVPVVELSSTASGAPAAPSFRLRIHSSAPLAVLRVGGRDTGVMRGATDLTMDLDDISDPSVAVNLDAVSTDGRHAAILVAPGAREATITFPQASPPAVRPPPAHAASHAAPLASSPYHYN